MSFLVEHSKRNSISTRAHVLFSILASILSFFCTKKNGSVDSTGSGGSVVCLSHDVCDTNFLLMFETEDSAYGIDSPCILQGTAKL